MAGRRQGWQGLLRPAGTLQAFTTISRNLNEYTSIGRSDDAEWTSQLLSRVFGSQLARMTYSHPCNESSGRSPEESLHFPARETFALPLPREIITRVARLFLRKTLKTIRDHPESVTDNAILYIYIFFNFQNKSRDNFYM